MKNKAQIRQKRITNMNKMLDMLKPEEIYTFNWILENPLYVHILLGRAKPKPGQLDTILGKLKYKGLHELFVLANYKQSLDDVE